jgi:hypothetical protein
VLVVDIRGVVACSLHRESHITASEWKTASTSRHWSESSVLIFVSAIFTRVGSIGISSEQGEALRSFLITVTEMSVEVELKHDRSVLDEMKKA